MARPHIITCTRPIFESGGDRRSRLEFVAAERCPSLKNVQSHPAVLRRRADIDLGAELLAWGSVHGVGHTDSVRPFPMARALPFLVVIAPGNVVNTRSSVLSPSLRRGLPWPRGPSVINETVFLVMARRRSSCSMRAIPSHHHLSFLRLSTFPRVPHPTPCNNTRCDNILLVESDPRLTSPRHARGR